MIFNLTTLGKILKYFYDNPYSEIYLRELSKKLGMSSYTTKNYVDKLVSEKILIESKRGKMRFFKANTKNLSFKYLKISYNLYKIEKSGLIEFLKRKVPMLTSIIIYGSIARGEDKENSDLDLLIIGKKVPLNLEKFRKLLKRNINPLIFKPSEWKRKAIQNKGFYQNIIADGIVVYGNLPMIE